MNKEIYELLNLCITWAEQWAHNPNKLGNTQFLEQDLIKIEKAKKWLKETYADK